MAAVEVFFPQVYGGRLWVIAAEVAAVMLALSWALAGRDARAPQTSRAERGTGDGMARIGFIGLGNMGLPMALNLIKAGHQVEGFDLSGDAVDKLVAAGGASPATVEDRGRRAPTSSSPCCRRASRCARSISGAAGIIENANAGTLLIDCSTIDVETARVGRRRGARPRACRWSMRRSPAASAARRPAR